MGTESSMKTRTPRRRARAWHRKNVRKLRAAGLPVMSFKQTLRHFADAGNPPWL